MLHIVDSFLSDSPFYIQCKNLPNVLESSPRITKYILRYLYPEDVHNLMLVNKRIYHTITNPNNYLYHKYMLYYYKDYYLFLYQRKTEIKFLPQILETIKESDTLYKKFYKTANCLVVIYFFCGLFLLLDIFVLLLILHKVIDHCWDIVPHIPIIIFWFLSLLILIIVLFLEKKLKKKLNKLIDEKIPEIDEETKEKLIKNITFRLRNQQPVSYKPVAFTALLCYIPIICKFAKSKEVDYKTTFLVVSFILALIFFVFDLIRIYVSKYNNGFEKIEDYKWVYSDRSGYDFFESKYNEDVIMKEKNSSLDEGKMLLLFFLWKMIIFGGIIYYAYLIGKKIDEPEYDVNWKILLIPVDFVGVLLALWGCLYIYSTKDYKIKKKWILYITIVIMMGAAAVNIIVFPNYLNEQNLTPYFPFIIDLVFTFAATIHYITLKVLRKTDSVYDLD